MHGFTFYMYGCKKGNIKSVENVMPKLFFVIEKEKGCK